MTDVEGDEGLVKVEPPGPLTSDHPPMPMLGVFAFNVVDVDRHKFWSGPAAASVGPVEIMIVTVEELMQVPLVMVHANT